MICFALPIMVVGLYAPASGEELAQPLSGKKVVMIIASKDFRDEELARPKALLEAEGAEVNLASSNMEPVKGMLGSKVKPDMLYSQIKPDEYDAVIFVGGVGASQYWNDKTAHSLAREALEAGKIVGAICIAPVTLAQAGILKDKKATVWPSEAGRLKAKGAVYTGASVTVDGKVITADGPESADAFGQAIIKVLKEE